MKLSQNDNISAFEQQPYEKRFLWLSLAVFTFYFLLALKTSFYLSAGFMVAVPLLLMFAYYLFKIPGLSIGLMIAATSLDVVGRLSGEGASIPVTVFHLMFFISLIIVVLKKIWNIDSKFRSTKIDFALLLFLVYIAITIFWARDREDAVINLARLIALVICMYVTLNLIESKASIKLTVFFIFLSAFALSAYSSRDFLTASSVQVKNSLAMLKLFSRFGATFDNPNYFATFLLLPLCLAFAGFVFLKIPYWKKILVFLMPSSLFVVAFVGTFSRSAWVALFISFIYMFTYFKHKKVWIIVVSIAGIVAVIALFQTAFFQSFVLRFASIFEGKADASSATRVYLFKGGLQMFLNSWFLGVGYQSFPTEYANYKPPSQTLGYVLESHTLPMEMLAELGLIGFALFVYLFSKVLKDGVLSIRKIEDNFWRTFQIGFVAFYIGLMINYCFMPDGLLSNLLWIAIGLIYGIKYIAEPKDVEIE